jgi:hypothetical protein
MRPHSFLLRPARRPGEDWNIDCKMTAANMELLRPAYGSGEDWNTGIHWRRAERELVKSLAVPLLDPATQRSVNEKTEWPYEVGGRLNNRSRRPTPH